MPRNETDTNGLLNRAQVPQSGSRPIVPPLPVRLSLAAAGRRLGLRGVFAVCRLRRIGLVRQRHHVGVHRVERHDEHELAAVQRSGAVPLVRIVREKWPTQPAAGGNRDSESAIDDVVAEVNGFQVQRRFGQANRSSIAAVERRPTVQQRQVRLHLSAARSLKGQRGSPARRRRPRRGCATGRVRSAG